MNVLAFEYQGRSLTTRPDQMAYLYRLLGYEDEWRPTRKTRVEYADLPTGTFDFQLRAVDRDLSYSHQTEVMVTVHPPYQIVVLFESLGIAVVGLIVVAGYAIKKRRDLFAEMEQELQTARDLQLGLMPNEAPTIKGLEIASRCVPATQVGGDFFQYFHHGDNLSISTTDVAGHAMQAAIPVVMFEGVLDTHLRLGTMQLEDLFARLNDVMAERLTGRTHVCFSMAQIDTKTRAVRFANAGCPYPYHYHAATSEVTELEANAYPFGVRAGTKYQAIETQLELGDRLVFCSDGIMEARNSAGDMFGFDQTAETVRQGCQAGLSAEGILEKLLGDVRTFSGDSLQEDDQTIVVVGVES